MNHKTLTSFACRIISIVIVAACYGTQFMGQHPAITQPANNQPATSASDGQFAVLVDGLGTYSRKISTKSEMAQKFFDQGLRLVYGYYSPEATASFNDQLGAGTRTWSNS